MQIHIYAHCTLVGQEACFSEDHWSTMKYYSCYIRTDRKSYILDTWLKILLSHHQTVVLHLEFWWSIYQNALI